MQIVVFYIDGKRKKNIKKGNKLEEAQVQRYLMFL